MVYPDITSPRSNTPLSVTLSPSEVAFTPSNWNTPQQITLSASGDDIDNDVDEETFEVLYYYLPQTRSFNRKQPITQSLRALRTMILLVLA